MAKKTSGTDIGYRAYFAAFAVMIISILAAVCILSGCLDGIIFKAEYPASGTETDSLIITPGTTQTPVDTEPSTEPSDSTGEIVETKEPEAESDTEAPDTEKDTEKADTSADTTKREEDTTAKKEDTTKKEETTTPAVSTPDTKDDILESERITEQDNSILYSYKSKALTVTGYDGDPSSISVAERLDGVKVTSIGKDAFAAKSNLTEVRLSAGITSIGSGAMSNCASLTAVYIPTTVKDIAADAFEGSGDVVIYCESGSYAEHFAIDNGIEYRNN